MTDLATETRRGRPPKSNVQRVGEAAEKLSEALKDISPQEWQKINRDLNMGHECLLADLQKNIGSLSIVCE